jgi:tetratricopeptide (TPR) repeat protein
MNRRHNRILLLIAIFLYIPLGLLQVKISYRRTLENLESRLLLMPGQMAGSLVLSGFKGIAADLLWLNIEDFWHKGQHYKMLPLFDAVSWLQPEYVTVWAVGGWHMAYNIFANVESGVRELEKQLDSLTGKLTETEKKKMLPVIRIAEEAKAIRENLKAYYTKGLTEKEQPEMLAKLTGYEKKLEEYGEGNKEIVEIVKKLVEIPHQQILWYDRGISFLKKGVSYNPEKYDLYFELGWTYYHKGQDYPNAVKYLEKAVQFPHPAYVDDVLAHAYELNGQVDKALAQWEKQLKAGNFTSIAERAIRCLKKEGAFNPKRRKELGLSD